MLNNSLNKNYIEVGGYKLPADFKYLEKDYLLTLINNDFVSNVKELYTKISGREFHFDCDIDSLEIFSIDDSICGINFSNGKNLKYSDFIFDNEDFSGNIYSIISIFIASYIELVGAEIINMFEEVNFSLPANDGVFVLALYIAKKMGLPIGTIIVGGDKPNNTIIKGVYYSSFTESEVEEILYVFYDEYDTVLDPVSILSICALDSYYDSYEDTNLIISLILSSPYLFSRKILKVITGKGEVDTLKAIDKLYYETSLEIPESIKNKEVPLFYNEKIILPFDTALSFIKTISKVWFFVFNML